MPSIFVHGLHNKLAQMLSLRSSSAACNICSGRLKVKVTLEGQMIKWSYIELVLCLCLYFKSIQGTCLIFGMIYP